MSSDLHGDAGLRALGALREALSAEDALEGSGRPGGRVGAAGRALAADLGIRRSVAVALGVALCFGAAAVVWWPSGGSRVPASFAPTTSAPIDPAIAAASPVVTAPEVVVHVAGAVAAPGLLRLPGTARVGDALDAAGGLAPDAAPGRLNLAQVLADGSQVYVPRSGEELIEEAPAAVQERGGAGLIDVNRAGAAELERLPGVGPVTAEAIVAHRRKVGMFRSVEDLLDVAGIGAAKLEQLRPMASV